ncbi:MAG: hypothetical protein RIQ53_1505 [Pseudomonadota bacterium]
MPASVPSSPLSSAAPGHGRLRRARWMIGVLALACVACAGPRQGVPEPARPDEDLQAMRAQLPARWTAAAEGDALEAWAAARGSDDAAVGWAGWDDPLLAQLLSIARQRSADLAVSQALLEAARAERRVAAAVDAGQIELTGGVYRGQPDRDKALHDAASLALQGRWEPDLSGRGAATRAQSEAALEEAGAGHAATAAALAVETAETYVARRGCEALALLERALLRSWQRSAEDQGRLADAGLLADALRARASAAVASAEARVLAVEARCDRLLLPLERLTGLPPDTLGRWLAEQPGRLPVAPAGDAGTLPAGLLAARPDLRQAIARLRQAAARQDLAASARWPRVSLSGLIGVGRHDSALTGSDSGAIWSLGPLQITLPLLDGGAAGARTAAARARYDAARAALLGTLRRALQEVQQAQADLADAGRRLTPLWQAADALGRAHEAARRRESAGLGDRLQTEAARRDALTAQQTLIACQLQRLQAWIALHHALGGAPDPAPTPAPARGNAFRPSLIDPSSPGVPR